MSQTKINIFKESLTPKAGYKGGKGKAEVLKKIGDKKLYKLSSNENILGSSPKAMMAMRDAMTNMSEYPDRTDIRLRKALSRFYGTLLQLSLIHISEPTRRYAISYAVFCLKKKK